MLFIIKMVSEVKVQGKKVRDEEDVTFFSPLKLSEILRPRMFFTVCVIINTFKPFLSFHSHLHVLVLSPP